MSREKLRNEELKRLLKDSKDKAIEVLKMFNDGKEN